MQSKEKHSRAITKFPASLLTDYSAGGALCVMLQVALSKRHEYDWADFEHLTLTSADAGYDAARGKQQVEMAVAMRDALLVGAEQVYG